MSRPLSLFTPSLLPAELLERLFVGRDQLLESIMSRVTGAAATRERNHTLIVGPRGSGKTHLVSLAHHRSGLLRGDGARLQRSWLPEDPWTIATYAHFLTRIVENLDPPLAEDLPRDGERLEAVLNDRAAAHGPIVVFVENFDQILAAIGPDGQRKLRHLLQADRSMLLVATTTTLSRDLSEQAAPFYSFFTTSRLDPLDVPTAAEMLSRIAFERHDQRTGEYLHTAQAQARLRAVAHLAGGQPRIWATLATALDVDQLDALVELLLTRFDELTPYYQEQLARLSPHQRRIVAELADADRPLNVTELAERCDIDQRSASKTLSELAERGWVQPTRSPLTAMLDRRRTYYELAEPLARLSFQLKAARGEPVRLVIGFLRAWFDPACGREPAESSGDGNVGVAPAVKLLGRLDDALSALIGANPEPLLALPSAVRTSVETDLDADDPGDAGAATGLRLRVHQHAADHFGDVHHPDVSDWIDRASDLIRLAPPDRLASAQLALATWLARAWRFEEAHLVLTEAATVLGADHPDTLRCWLDLASSSREAGRVDEAVGLTERVLVAAERVLAPRHPLAERARELHRALSAGPDPDRR